MSNIFVWTFSDVAGLIMLAFILIVAGFFVVKGWVKQLLCKHEQVRENMACHAICRSCGKDLGFIGKFREAENNG